MSILLILNIFFSALPTSAMNFSQRLYSTFQDCSAYQSCQEILDYEEQLKLDANKSDEERIKEHHWWTVFQRRLGDIAWCGTKATGAAALSGYLMSNPNFLMFTGMIGMGFRDKIENSINSFNTALWPNETWQKLDQLDLKLMLAEKYIPKSRYEHVLDKLKEIRMQLANQYHDKPNVLREIRRIETLLNLPMNKVSLGNLDKTAVLQEISKKMVTYNPRLVESLQEMAYEFMVDSSDPETITKSSYFFLGVPGTGKTTTAKMIATQVKRYFCPINLSKIEPHELLDGRQGPENSDQVRMGKIAQCFIEAGTLGVIFFFDEVHDVLNPKNKQSAQWQSVLKRLTDEDEAFIIDEGLRTVLDIRKSKFIFAANRPSDDTEGALMDRMSMLLLFPPADLSARKVIADDHFSRWHKEYSQRRTNIAQDKIYQDIIQYDAKHCKDDGVRTLKKVVKRYARYLGLKETGPGAKSSSKFDVTEKFREAQGIRLEDWIER